jgi:homoserine kinase type II
MVPEPWPEMTAYDAVKVAAEFGVNVIDASKMAGGWVNSNWLVTARDGSRFVVRRYEGLNVTQWGIAFQHAAMRQAAEQIPEVRPPLVGPYGFTFAMYDDQYFAVFPYIDGRTGQRAAFASAASVLAHFHEALAGFHGKEARAASSAIMLAWLRQQFKRFAARRALARKLDWDALMPGVVRSWTIAFTKGRKLPLTTVHGDPHPDNFVVVGGDVTGLIDFDFCHETERVYDVASSADAFGRSDEDAPLDLGAAAAFAAAYHAEAPLTDEEWQLIPSLMIRRNAFLVWYLVRRHGERAVGDVGNAERYVRRVVEIHRLRPDWPAAPS